MMGVGGRASSNFGNNHKIQPTVLNPTPTSNSTSNPTFSINSEMLENQDNHFRNDLGLPYSSSDSTLGMSEEDAPSLAKEVLTHINSLPIQDFLTTEAAPSEPKSSLHMTLLLKEDNVSNSHQIQADEDFPSGSQRLPKPKVSESVNFYPSFKVTEVLKPSA